MLEGWPARNIAFFKPGVAPPDVDPELVEFPVYYTKDPKRDHNFDDHPCYESVSTSISISPLIWTPKKGPSF